MRFLKPSSLIKIQNISAIKPSQIHIHGRNKPRPNELLKEYLNTNATSEALLLFRNLIRKNTSAIDSFSLLYITKICTRNPSPHEAPQFHTLIVKLGYESIIFIQTSLVNFYSSVANLENARQVFDEMPTRNVVCWTVIISAYIDNQKPNSALELFREMQMDNLEPDQITITVVLSACADLGALETGKWIHNYIRRTKKIDKDLSLYNALLNMYTKCGDLENAKKLFISIKKKDVTTWTSMITGYAIHGQAKEALSLFTKMTKTKIVPNEVTFMGVLMACSHVSMVDEGKRVFEKMIKDYGLKPKIAHFGCMVDLLCRGGRLQEAKDFILRMPMKPNAVLWRMLLGGCGVFGGVDLAEEVRGPLVELGEDWAGDDVVMGNVYGSSGIWEKKESVRNRISERRIPGCSWIEVGSEMNEFVAGGCDHPFGCKIYEVIGSLMGNMRAYVCSFDDSWNHNAK